MPPAFVPIESQNNFMSLASMINNTVLLKIVTIIDYVVAIS